MKRGNTDCRRFQKRRDWIRQRLKFTVKIIFFDAAIGSKNYALQEYLSKDSGQPICKLYFTMNSLEQRQCVTLFREVLHLLTKSLLDNIFVYNFSPKPSEVKYIIIV